MASNGEQKDNTGIPEPLANNIEDDANEIIAHPTIELYRHTLLRGANLGSVVALIVGPPLLLLRGVRKPGEILRRMAIICTKGMGVGVAFAAVMTLMRTWGNTDEQMYDRCYRLHYNKGQVRMDNFSYGAAVLGGVAGVAGLPAGPVAGAIQGASMGLGLSVAAHVLTKGKEKVDKE